MAFGPHGGTQALYYTTYTNGGQVRRITFGDPEPSASFTATPAEGLRPLTVAFDASASRGSNGGPLKYQWVFGDGNTLETSTPTASNTYGADGAFVVDLKVIDTLGREGSAKRLIQVGSQPSPKITGPAPSARFAVGERVTLTGTANDLDDGPLPDGNLSWQVVLHHNTHTHPHPFLGPVSGNNIVIKYPQPENLQAATNSYLEVTLTATDSSGVSRSVSQNLVPAKVNLTVVSNPSGAKLKVEGETFKSRKTFVAWVGQLVDVSTPTVQKISRKKFKFVSWSDGRKAAHQIKLPARNQTLTAKFTRLSKKK